MSATLQTRPPTAPSSRKCCCGGMQSWATTLINALCCMPSLVPRPATGRRITLSTAICCSWYRQHNSATQRLLVAQVGVQLVEAARQFVKMLSNAHQMSTEQTDKAINDYLALISAQRVSHNASTSSTLTKHCIAGVPKSIHCSRRELRRAHNEPAA